MKKGLYLKDEVAANLISSDLEYAKEIIAKTTGIDEKYIQDLRILSPRVTNNINVKNRYVDALYTTDESYYNIEINYTTYPGMNTKNISYICHLIINQTKKGKLDNKLKGITQININNFDYYNKGELYYISSIMEEKNHIKREENIKIIDISLPILEEKDYNEISNKEKEIYRLFYVFITNNKNKIKEFYEGDELMEKVVKKLDELTEDFYEGFYYDKEKLDDITHYNIGHKEGYEEGSLQKQIAIIKNMLDNNYNDDEIIKITNITQEELDAIKKEKDA